MSLISRSPHWQTRVTCPRRRRQAAVARAASRANESPARAHQNRGLVFCTSPSAASAAAPRPRCRRMFSVWASAPHFPLCGVRVPATGHCACRCTRDLYDNGALGWVDNGACDAVSREKSAGASTSARVLCCALRLSCQCLRALCV
jgi:hypothetical protein